MSNPISSLLQHKLKLFIGLVLVLAGITFWQVQQMEKDAFRLANAGRTTAKTLGALAKALATGDSRQVADFYSTSYSNPQGKTWRESLLKEEGGIQYFTWREDGERVADKQAIDQMVTTFLSDFTTLTYTKFKLAAIKEIKGSHEMTAKVTLWLRGTRDEAVLEAKIPFYITLANEDDGWKVTRQELLSGTTVVGPGKGFVDVAADSGLGEMRNRRNPDFQTSAWNPERFPIAQYSSAGVSTADYDGDGFYDLFFPNGNEAHLFRNQGDGTFKDVTVAAGLPADLIGVNTAVFADFDNDGHTDLFMGRFTRTNKLFRNLGDGTFEDVSGDEKMLGDPLVAVSSAADYDNDGDLDLYLGRYLDPRDDLPTTPFYTRNGQNNTLLRNDGNFQFTDVTEEAGVGEKGLSLGVVWADYDLDGYSDLYVANDFGRNTLFHNKGDGTFEDVSAVTGTVDLGFGMSATWGDLDNDLDMDIYVANVHSGQRWYGQAATLKNYIATSFKQGTITEDWPIYKEIYTFLGADWMRAGDHIIKGNSLLLNDGKGNFTDVAVAANANPFGWFWGSTMFDYDNDGLQDLYSANGWVSNHNKDDF